MHFAQAGVCKIKLYERGTYRHQARRAIKQVLTKGGNPGVTVIEFPGLNHLFQSSQTGAVAVAEYDSNEETINTKALNTISDWLRGSGPDSGLKD